ncbi:MAG: hypothetical protein K0B10_00845 [Vicingaceae bacterium]|nr:hypothetical protein [Vicingaceae bacterium]
MKSFVKIAIFCAGTILVLHSCIAHNHQKNNSNPQFYSVNEPVNLQDFLSDIFSLNIGENHLTNFVTQALEVESNLEFFNSTFYLSTFIFKAQHYYKELALTGNFPHRIISSNPFTELLFRGPPIAFQA